MALSLTYKGLMEEYKRFKREIPFDIFEEEQLRRLGEMGEYVYYTDRHGAQIKLDRVDHFPKLKEYEVWMEGYAATGEHQKAHLVGKVKARNFAQACHLLMCKKKLEWIEKENDPNSTLYHTPARWDYNPQNLSYWGMGLHWSEEQAKRAFG